MATSKNESTTTGQSVTGQSGDASVDASVAEVQANMDEITDQGYQGARTDPTPLENYTVEGVTSGAPTPETDADAAAKAAEATGAQPQVR